MSLDAPVISRILKAHGLPGITSYREGFKLGWDIQQRKIDIYEAALVNVGCGDSTTAIEARGVLEKAKKVEVKQ